MQDAVKVVILANAVELEDVKLPQASAELAAGHQGPAPGHLPVCHVLGLDVLVQRVQVAVKLPGRQVHLVDDCHHAADDGGVCDCADDEQEHKEGPHPAADQGVVVPGTLAGGDPLNPPRERVEVMLQLRGRLGLRDEVREKVFQLWGRLVVPAYDRHEARDPMRGDEQHHEQHRYVQRLIIDREVALVLANYPQAPEDPENLQEPEELEDAKRFEVPNVIRGLPAGVPALDDVEGRDGHEVDEEHALQVAPEDFLLVHHPLPVFAFEGREADDEHVEHEREVDVLIDPE